MFDDTVIQEAGRRILEAAPAGSRVILFGSHARGDASEHSDLDLLVIEPSVEGRARESVRLHKELAGLDVFADIIVVSEENVHEWRDVYGTVIHSALTEGRELGRSALTDRPQVVYTQRTRTSLDLAHQLLERASERELVVRTLLNVPGVTDVGIGFYASGAVEKSIKAVLAANGLRFPLTEDLQTLAGFCARSGIQLPATLDGMEELTPYATAQLHDTPTPPASLDRTKALDWATTAVTWARTIIEDAQAQQNATDRTDENQTTPKTDS